MQALPKKKVKLFTLLNILLYNVILEIIHIENLVDPQVDDKVYVGVVTDQSDDCEYDDITVLIEPSQRKLFRMLDL